MVLMRSDIGLNKKRLVHSKGVCMMSHVEIKRFRQMVVSACMSAVFLMLLSACMTDMVHAQATVKTASISAEKRYIETESVEFDVDLKIPVFSEMADEELQAKLNAMFEKKAKEFAEDIVNQSVAFVRDAEEYGFPMRTFAAYTDYKVTLNTQEFLSLYITYYSFTGGAHGMTFIEVYNVDLRTGEFVELKDMFVEGVDYRTPINEEIRRLMSEEPDRYFRDMLLRASITSEQLFYLTEEGIVVHFGLYELAPYSSGMSEFLITYDKLKTLLDETYIFLLNE